MPMKPSASSAMKLSLSFLSVCALLLLLLAGCHEKEVIPSQNEIAYVIGFHPCTAHAIKKAYILELPQTKDTVVTYNLPDSLYQFPKELFRDKLIFLFPLSEQKKYPVRLTYHQAQQQTLIACTTDIHLVGYDSVVEGREIIVESAQRPN